MHKLLVWSGNDNLDVAAQYAVSADFVKGLAGQEGAGAFINTHAYQGAVFSHLRKRKADPSPLNPLLMGRAGVQRHIEIFGNTHRARTRAARHDGVPSRTPLVNSPGATWVGFG
ncbi:hypothetical protein [Streptomyces sp. NPDC102360]|uniref:hypothetical protein n=1 Tax=Streptomyces sp. NPDC102360 TaxID=3366160 RepID=UPI0037F60873